MCMRNIFRPSVGGRMPPHANDKEVMVQHKVIVPRRRAWIVAVVAALTIGPAIMPAAASAASSWWRAGSLCAGCQDAGPTRTQLTSSYALAESYSRKIQAGAHWAGNWTLHGSFAEGWGEACQNYPGTRALRGQAG
jgi:hypothetical protein